MVSECDFTYGSLTFIHVNPLLYFLYVFPVSGLSAILGIIDRIFIYKSVVVPLTGICCEVYIPLMNVAAETQTIVFFLLLIRSS